jgi:predicted enzyme related to lactoylglutathione lyase
MKVGSIGWLGVRTENLPAMCSFYRDVLRLEATDNRRAGS